MLRTETLEPAPGSATPDLAAARRTADRSGLAEAVEAWQREIGAPEPAIAAARRLADPDAAVIVTGQQPGLAGGPILTLAKAMSAIAFARRLATDSGRPVIPVFWVASEDHDLEEVNRVDLLTARDEPLRLSLPLEAGPTMLSRVHPGDAADELVARIGEALPDSEYAGAVLASIAAEPGDSLGTWFARILARWLGPAGLVLVEPRLVRRAAAEVLALERSRPGAIAAACGPGPLAPADPPFFLVRDGRRSRPGAAADLPADPRAVSFDVVTRVLAQNVALPVAGHVVGPSEARYCAQIAPAHALFGVPAPPLLDRARLTLVEGKVEKAIRRFGTTLAAVVAGGESALTANAPRPEAFEDALSGLESALSREFPEVRNRAGELDETLLRKAAGAEKELMTAIDRLRDHARRAMERVTGQDAERRRKLLAHLRPAGEPQERVLSPLPFLFRHGLSLIERLLAVVESAPNGNRAVFLKGA